MRVMSTRASAARIFAAILTTCSGVLPAPKIDLGKTLAERAVGVHLRETEVGYRRSLERPQDLVPAHPARAELFQQLNRLGNSHN